MALLALQASATAEKQLRIVRPPSMNDQHTAPAAEAIAVGAPIRMDTATGRWTNANGSIIGELATHVAWKPAQAGESLTGIRRCLVDGFVLDALNYGDTLYVSNTDGRLDTVVGTVSQVAGRVVSAHAQLLGVGADKLLDIGGFGA